jgi:hypothetical protein
MDERTDQRSGTVAVIAILAAIGSYIATFTGHPIIGLVAAVASLPLGALGMALAISPRVGGGLISLGALILGAIGVVVAILGIIGVIIF